MNSNRFLTLAIALMGLVMVFVAGADGADRHYGQAAGSLVAALVALTVAVIVFVSDTMNDVKKQITDQSKDKLDDIFKEAKEFVDGLSLAKPIPDSTLEDAHDDYLEAKFLEIVQKYSESPADLTPALITKVEKEYHDVTGHYLKIYMTDTSCEVDFAYTPKAINKNIPVKKARSTAQKVKVSTPKTDAAKKAAYNAKRRAARAAKKPKK